MKIAVTEADIEEGRPCNPQYCPVALALRRATGSQSVGVFRKYVRVNYVRYDMPDEMAEWIDQFDSLDEFPCDPAEFEVPGLTGGEVVS